VLALLAEQRVAADADRGQQQRALQRLDDEQQKLLQAHYANAVPLDLLRSEMDRLERERDVVSRRASALVTDFDRVEEGLDRALYLASHCAEMYRLASPSERRLINQAIFEKLYLGYDEGVEAADTVDLFTVLFDPETPALLIAEAKALRQSQQRQRRRSAAADSAPSAVLSSSETLLVREEGLEPSRPCGHRNLNPARLPIPPLARVSSAL
jgi:site-specific DNA recombinase